MDNITITINGYNNKKITLLIPNSAKISICSEVERIAQIDRMTHVDINIDTKKGVQKITEELI